MRLSTFVAASVICAFTSFTLADSFELHPPSSSQPNFDKRSRSQKRAHLSLQKRDPATDDRQAQIGTQAASDPVGAALAAQNLDGIKNNIHGGDLAGGTIIQGDSWSAENPQDNQYPWNHEVFYYPNAAATPGDAKADGWVQLPQLGGFDLKRDVIRDNASMPYYITSGYDPKAIKKAVLVFPGKNRDSWKYTNLIRNAFQVALTNFPNLGLTNGSVITIGPAVMNHYDVQFGAAQPGDISWHGSLWSDGAGSEMPVLDDRISFFEVLDYFNDWLFNTTNFPNLNSVTIAGHSMGGQSVQRYALLKKQKVYDDNIHYVVGNPGSWAWLVDTRPVPNATCVSPDPDEWKYGMGGNVSKIPKYARKDIVADKQAIVNRYRSRRVHYELALLDNGPGDTRCQAVMQGGNHLDRGSNFIQMLGAMSGGFPVQTQTVDFIANVSHQDYAMLSANQTLIHLFKDGYDQRLPDINATNPGDKKPKPTVHTPLPNPPQHAFATYNHKVISYALLFGSVGGVAFIFTILPFIFKPNSDPWEDEKWAHDPKRRLMQYEHF